MSDVLAYMSHCNASYQFCGVSQVHIKMDSRVPVFEWHTHLQFITWTPSKELNAWTCLMVKILMPIREDGYRYKPSSALASSLCAIKLSLAYFWSSSIFFLLTKASSICGESIQSLKCRLNFLAQIRRTDSWQNNCPFSNTMIKIDWQITVYRQIELCYYDLSRFTKCLIVMQYA